MKCIYGGHSKESGIYKIINIKNNRLYIGAAREFKNRAQGHLRSLRKGTHHNKFLQRDFNKCGEDAFEFHVSEVVVGSKEDRFEIEKGYILKEYDGQRRCYNSIKTLQKNKNAFIFNEDKPYKDKVWLLEHYYDKGLSTTAIGKLCKVKACTIIYWARNHGIALRSKSEALSGARNPMFARLVSKETRQKLSAAGTGRKHTEETKQYLSRCFLGKPKSLEHKKKMSEAAFKRFAVKENHPRWKPRNTSISIIP